MPTYFARVAEAAQDELQDHHWKVGVTQRVSYAPPIEFQREVRVQMRATCTEVGYGFSIQNARGAPLLTVTYATEAESKQAEEQIRQAIGNAVNVGFTPIEF